MRTKATIKGIIFFITTILCLFLIGEGLNLMNQPDDFLFTIGAALVPVSVVGALILSQEVVRLVIREYLEKNDINNLNQR